MYFNCSLYFNFSLYLCKRIGDVQPHWPGCSIQQQFKKFNVGNIPEPPSFLLLYHTISYKTIHNTIQNYTITYNSIQYHTIPYNTPIPCCTIQYSSLPPFLYYTTCQQYIPHNILPYNILLYNVLPTLFYHTIFSLPPSRSTIQCTISAAKPFLKFNLPIS